MGMQDIQTLVCTHIEAERTVALFEIGGQETEVFAYLPHVPGINPWLLQVGDEVQGCVMDKDGRLELTMVQGVSSRAGSERRSDRRSLDLDNERTCRPFPRR